ncbi:alpha-1,2-fucosyltransferase [Nostoc sp. FACHB-110]|uniref:alpha-1,2-fucosyltransferase n=1 Tax=Nostoc sp. FACHB-110 TaxID=2692834 RepID=UPI001682683C|nr:alpha-1,2-fucosyltransferase [Nostoc sp. FACHB-110]MBD2440641.1 alpha-1,2-fucosyltransferase [Nostoc sp. FACHB-110]
MLVISAKSGQLGNRLLLFANFLAFAIEYNCQVLNPAFEEYADFFSSTAKDLFCRFPATYLTIPANKRLRKYYYKFNRYLAESGRFNTINIQREQPFNWSNSPDLINELKTHHLNFFQGWLFRDGWFINDMTNLSKHKLAIREYFRPLKVHQVNVSHLISKIRQTTDVIIGVHIRQGDYLQHQNGKYFYNTQAYIKVMASILELFPAQQVTFLICSNQQQEKSDFQHLPCVFANNHIIEDMYSLAECDYIIGPPSSYSMWASFYGERPLYMIRDINKTVAMTDFVNFYQWQGKFYPHQDWGKSYWQWTH